MTQKEKSPSKAILQIVNGIKYKYQFQVELDRKPKLSQAR